MNKKIIIKESQYKRIVALLFENTKVENILKTVQPNSILNIIDNNGKTYTITILKVNGDILNGKDDEDVDIEIDVNDYDNVNNTLTINKINPITRQPISVSLVVSDIEILGNQETDDTDNTSIDSDELNQPDNKEFKNYYIDVMRDPDLTKAFYTAPTFWNYFVAALKNKKARGTGIIPAYDIINKHYRNKIDQKFPGFTDKENKRAMFYLFEDVEIKYNTFNDETNRKIMTLDHGYRKATVRQYEAGLGDVKVLTYRSSGGNYGYKIVVKKETGDNPDEFFCDIYVNNNKTEENKFKKSNVRLRFLNSDGYVSYNKLNKTN